MAKKAYLILENGEVFEGKSFGYEKEVMGEVVFSTAMTGYVEALTDPGCYGQIVTQTFPLIGNYGVMNEDYESKKSWVSAYVVREWCDRPSNFRCEGDIDSFLKKEKIPGIYGIDTRKLTKIVREYGVMNGMIAYENKVSDELLEKLKEYKISNPISLVTCDKIEEPIGNENGKKVVLWDFGAKKSISEALIKRGMQVIKVPASTSAKEILELKPDGIMLSNGPGDPRENKEIIEEIKKVCEAKIPTFGICMGHQLLALSQGASTEKLKYGHRGENQPAKDVKTGRVYVTSQNHDYAIVEKSLPKGAEVGFVNANDGTCEGISYSNMPAFSVQFHPEASGGPLDTEFLFDEFVKMIEGGCR